MKASSGAATLSVVGFWDPWVLADASSTLQARPSALRPAVSTAKGSRCARVVSTHSASRRSALSSAASRRLATSLCVSHQLTSEAWDVLASEGPCLARIARRSIATRQAPAARSRAALSHYEEAAPCLLGASPPDFGAALRHVIPSAWLWACACRHCARHRARRHSIAVCASVPYDASSEAHRRER
ncbi:hypothetical protein BI312_22600 [Xanthomonas citri pv. citri]|uniref:Uncharacterized protein n=1 Tax=Xanthomonas axonopodis pv. citri (strain 306) TaxID=190486 RepID=A0AAI8ERI0_XANAC|nr:hypothetical protein XAC1745 [Xanthomonas citri pv. citri str. 306]AGI08108.1 Hypothetical protein XCAW_02323 [Xanthomonas citri subsp. citri Aw12879]APR11373.1 hypothetical protein BI314_15590 [Xanthomonas citri pv. citri]QYF44585.1 hypothetical protein HZS93_01879 [Xanthomonas citri]APR17194.1 hypothetical protein BI315_22635 [Xanthomonas citri pv. citri]